MKVPEVLMGADLVVIERQPSTTVHPPLGLVKTA